MIPQDALRVTGWDTLNPNTVSVRAEEEEKKNLRNMSWFMQKALQTTYLDPGTENRLPLSLEMYLVTGDENIYLEFMQVRGKRKVSPNFFQ